MKKIIFILYFLFTNFSYSQAVIETIWGKNYVITDPLLDKLINSDVIMRLQFIDQSGPLIYFNKAPKFSRYEHSVGVLALLLKARVSLKEQVAGLLHDASHTAFSHVADHLFHKDNQEKSYQDMVHLEFLHEMKIDDLLSSYAISIDDLDPDYYTALEQPHPKLCADRIQYIIHTGVIFNKLSTEEAHDIILDLSFHEGKWYFTSSELAYKFAELSLYFTKELWGAPWNLVLYEYFAEVLKRALKLNIININDIKFGKDENIMALIKNSNDKFIQDSLEHLHNIDNIFTITAFNKGDLNIKPKFRGVDPEINIGNNFMYLSHISEEYAQKFHEVKSWCMDGFGINMLVTYKPDNY